MSLKGKAAQKAWIVQYLNESGFGVSSTDEPFHDAFYDAFGGKRSTYLWGSAPVYKAQRLLREMYKDGILTRSIFPLPESGHGFPNWVYVYELRSKEHNMRE